LPFERARSKVTNTWPTESASIEGHWEGESIGTPARQIAIGLVVAILGGALGGFMTLLLTPQPGEEAIETFYVGPDMDPVEVDLDPGHHEVWVDHNEELTKTRLMVKDDSGNEVVNSTMTGTFQRNDEYFGSFESDGGNYTFMSNLGATVYLTGHIEPFPEELSMCSGYAIVCAGFIIMAIGFVRRFFREPEGKQSRQDEGQEETDD
jgi:hypothetical protein